VPSYIINRAYCRNNQFSDFSFAEVEDGHILYLISTVLNLPLRATPPIHLIHCKLVVDNLISCDLNFLSCRDRRDLISLEICCIV
jgi:hypothetical protein